VRTTLGRDAGAPSVDAEAVLMRFLEERLDKLLTDLAPQGLAQVADAFRAERARVFPDAIAREEAERIKSRKMLLPLLPQDFVTADGSRVVRSLTTGAELQEHGEALEICLAGGWQRFRYRFACQHGGRILLGILDAVTGAPLSTADIRLNRVAGFGACTLELKQHTARRNTPPSPTCRRAVSELLVHCRSPEVRRHLLEGWHLLSYGSTGGARFAQPADILWHAADREALRTTLGAERYDSLLAEAVRARRGDASEG